MLQMVKLNLLDSNGDSLESIDLGTMVTLKIGLNDLLGPFALQTTRPLRTQISYNMIHIKSIESLNIIPIIIFINSIDVKP